MQQKILSPAETEMQILDLLKSHCPLFFATNGKDGFPDIRALAFGASDGVGTLWFSTSVGSKKIAQLRANPNAAVYTVDMGGFSEFRLYGTVEIRTDMDARQKVWKDSYIEYWPDGIESPDMAVLEFKTLHGLFFSVDAQGTWQR